MSHPLELEDLVSGTHLGHYVITDKIAQGGMGTVFKAVSYTHLDVYKRQGLPHFWVPEFFYASGPEANRSIPSPRRPRSRHPSTVSLLSPILP